MAKRTKYPIHSDFKKWSHFNPPLKRFMVPTMQRLMSLLFLCEKSTKQLKVEKKRIPVGNGDTIRALWYCPKDVGDNAPCLIYYHGGGFVIPPAPYQFNLAKEYALRARCKMLFVDYRLAPKYKFPTAPEDCYAAYMWVIENADELKIDPTHIAVAGDSAGGQLSTVVCLMAQERGQALPCCQMMIYPAVGGVETESMKMFTDTPMCNSKDVEYYTNYYVAGALIENPVYCSPIEAESLQGLPDAYIETAEFDCLRDEAILYAERLEQFGVHVELHNTKGTMHGFDIVLQSPIVRECMDNRVAFFTRNFSKKPTIK